MKAKWLLLGACAAISSLPAAAANRDAVLEVMSGVVCGAGEGTEEAIAALNLKLGNETGAEAESTGVKLLVKAPLSITQPVFSGSSPYVVRAVAATRDDNDFPPPPRYLVRACVTANSLPFPSIPGHAGYTGGRGAKLGISALVACGKGNTNEDAIQALNLKLADAHGVSVDVTGGTKLTVGSPFTASAMTLNGSGPYAGFGYAGAKRDGDVPVNPVSPIRIERFACVSVNGSYSPYVIGGMGR